MQLQSTLVSSLKTAHTPENPQKETFTSELSKKKEYHIVFVDLKFSGTKCRKTNDMRDE